MVFRRFHRTAGPVFLLAVVGIIVAIVLPMTKIKGAGVLPLQFAGYTNVAGELHVSFLLTGKRGSGLFNLTSLDQQGGWVVFREASGQTRTNAPISPIVDFASNAIPRIRLAVPTNAVEYSVTFFQRVRKGRMSNGTGSSPASAQFLIPWGTIERYESGTIRLTNAMAEPGEPAPRGAATPRATE